MLKLLGLITLTIGQNHPVCIPQQLTMQPPPAPTSTTSLHKNRGKLAWPNRGTGSSKKISTIYHNQSGSVLIRPIVVPKFVSDPKLPVQPGYQEAHKLYDEMRQFFAQKAMSVHAGEVVVIKVTMMSWKPGHRNPSIVSVRKQTSTSFNSNP
jgi:hypothetical protein